ncbi:hypothetical protein D9M71_654620 [compost metagenome]
MITNGLCFVSQVIGIYTDAVTTHQSWAEWQEVPFRPRCFQNRLSIDTHLIKNKCQLIDQGNVQVALRVLNNLCRFGNLDTLGFMSSGDNDCVIQSIDQISNLWSGTGGYFFNGSNTMLFITRIYPLWAITCIKINIELQPGYFLQHWNTIFLSSTRIDR